ncbi:MAG: hypothetical protein COT17_05885 [Elusimicrobia bacterium CG08_land_8_20_14_0_20_51_18]|nr:MAG: hypothetical protein COT17_05885 [Elusimicrobia bacterium CG08_land_8_20_14_0_20_51_18]
MKTCKTGTLTFLLCAALSLVPAAAWAETTVTAAVDRQTVPINESVTLVVSISGDDATMAKPEIPSMTNFNVYSAGKSSNITMINGRISSSVEYTYVLSPRYLGKTRIPAVPVFNGREKFLTREIEITVLKAASSAQPPVQQTPAQRKNAQADRPARSTPREKLVFLRAETDKKSAYLGEQVNLTIRFYTSIPIASNPQYFPPKLDNLISEDLPPIRSGEMVIGGIRYYYSEIKSALFGIDAGKAGIGPAQVMAQIQKEEDIDPFDPNFMQKFFSGFSNSENVTLNSKSRALQILSLPEPQPVDFTGAVGNFFISTELDRKEARQGEALNFTVKLSGKGNIKAITKPELKTADFKVYDTLVSYTNTKNNDIIGGEKKFTYVLSSRETGTKTIPPVRFSFFNIDSKRYETIDTQPVTVRILQGETGKTYDFTNTNPQSPAVNKLSSDIKYIFDKPGISGLGAKASERIADLPLYAGLFFLFPALVSFFASRSHLERIKNPFLYAFKNAEAKLNAQIKKAQKENAGGNSSRALSLIYDGIVDYLSAKLRENVYSLTIQKTLAALKAKYPSVNDYAEEELKNILEEIEFMNYASSNVNRKSVENTAEKLRALTAILEKEFKR